MNQFQQQEIDKWLVRQNEAINEAEAAMRRVRFAEQMLDRLLGELAVNESEEEKPHLYLVVDNTQQG